ncbi:hypothetical protein LPJ63_005027 [Coemansia sp. RSA 2711]|nr:hypothetical protein LPJ63_005027 [Coemansia sp. RSA 2711]KAJ2304392.1 hypothetical protein IWW54_005418 [Coemansia sp. RSA 2705]
MLKSLLTAAGLALGMAVQAIADPLVIGYYAAWKQEQAKAIDLSKYTHINIAFGIPETDGSITFPDPISLPDVVGNIHQSSAKALLSIGGWSGSYAFSDILKSQTASANLMAQISKLIKDNALDGIDIDWEYPGRAGDTCNVFDETNDTPNLLKFLQQLRASLDSQFGAGKKLITMATRLQPFDVDSVPLTDVTAFAKVLDFINLMIYDINGSWMPQTAPNAPFDYEDGQGSPVSFITAIDAWTKAGWPASKLNAGVPFYGRSTTALVDMTKDPKNQYQNQSSVLPQGDREDLAALDKCANATSVSGTWQWRLLREQGVLTSPTTAAAPWIRQWDDITKTPWLFNPNTKQYITYDDPTSLKIKVDYAAAKGLGGIMVWALYMDYQNELLDVIHTWGDAPAAGKPCTAEGQLTCKDLGGQSPDYLVCLYGKWMQLACNPNTACLPNNNSIVCGWPRHHIF